MRLVLILIVFVIALVLKNDAAQPEPEARIAVLERNVQMLTTSVLKVLAEVRLISKRCDQQQNYLAQHPEHDLGDESRNLKMDPQLNDTNLEERVQALEFQMANVHDDITSINDDITALNVEVTDLDEDVEAQFVLVEGEITVVNEQITIIFEEIFQLEDETDSLDSNIQVIEQNIEELTATDSELTASIDELDSRVTTLESLNGTNGDVDDALDDLDERVSRLELDGTFAFHASLQSYSSLPEETPVIFNNVIENLGNGYDSTTGLFTVPSGGAGLYFMYSHLLIEPDEVTYFDIRLNGVDVCEMYEDNNGSGDHATTSCGAVAVLEEGDVVGVYNDFTVDNTPIEAGTRRSTFSGFRIAPQ